MSNLADCLACVILRTVCATQEGYATQVIFFESGAFVKILRKGLFALLKISAVCIAAHVVAAPGGGGSGKGGSGNPAVLGPAAATADGGLQACSSRAGSALYGCVADVLEKLGNDVASGNAGQARTELLRTASALRSAVNKAAALLAITKCQTVISAALSQASARGRDASGFSAIIGVLARAARLIQAKG